MPTFHTPQPVALTIELGVGAIRVVAGDRTETVVEVRPTDPTKAGDVTAAERTRVDYGNGMLVIKMQQGWRQYSPRAGTDSVDVLVELPAGSGVRGTAGMASLRCSGPLGECRYRTGLGDVQVDDAQSLEVRAGSGDVGVGRTGRADVTTGAGAVRIGRVDGTAVIKSSSGDIWIGEAGGDLRATAANGTISVDRAHATVVAKTARGDVRLGEVARGEVVAQTAFGALDIGVRAGVPAWLDLSTAFGTVRSDLDATEHPEQAEVTVDVHARTSYGDITIRRCGAPVPTA